MHKNTKVILPVTATCMTLTLA